MYVFYEKNLYSVGDIIFMFKYKSERMFRTFFVKKHERIKRTVSRDDDEYA